MKENENSFLKVYFSVVVLNNLKLFHYFIVITWLCYSFWFNFPKIIELVNLTHP